MTPIIKFCSINILMERTSVVLDTSGIMNKTHVSVSIYISENDRQNIYTV